MVLSSHTLGDGVSVSPVNQPLASCDVAVIVRADERTTTFSVLETVWSLGLPPEEILVVLAISPETPVENVLPMGNCIAMFGDIPDDDADLLELVEALLGEHRGSTLHCYLG